MEGLLFYNPDTITEEIKDALLVLQFLRHIGPNRATKMLAANNWHLEGTLIRVNFQGLKERFQSHMSNLSKILKCLRVAYEIGRTRKVSCYFF